MKSIPRRFRLTPRGVLVAALSAAFSGPALANTGRVDFAIGRITVTGSDGQGRPLTKGAEVRSGDRIVSSVDGRAQIRFADGAYVSLQPNSEFDIREYRFSGKADGTESALFGLFKGAMRTVTGLVGGVNRSRYQVSTPTATIGIRGTGGLIAIGGDGSTLVTGTSGIWSLTNKGGTLDIPAGTAGFAGPDVTVPPRPSTRAPVVPPQSAPPLPTIVQGDVVDSNGIPVSLKPPTVPTVPPILTSGPGYAVAYFGAGGANNLQFAGPAVTSPSNAVFDGSGLLTQFDGLTGLPTAPTPATFTLAGSQLESGTNGVLAWGRWTGVVLMNGTPFDTLTANQGLHYVAGLPTPAASMPTGVTFTYNMIGATNPTLANGSIAPGVLNSASLVGNFATGVLNVSLSATAGGTVFTASAAGLIAPTFTATGTGTGTGGSISCTSCSVNVNGFFSGAGATHAGIMYQVGGLAGGSTLNGAAALQR